MVLDTEGGNASWTRLFRFEAMWTLVEESSRVVDANWYKRLFGSPTFKEVKKLKLTKEALKVWNKHSFRGCTYENQNTQGSTTIDTSRPN